MLILAYDDFSYLTPLMGVLLHNEYNKLTRNTDAWKYKHISYLFLSHYFVLRVCSEIYALVVYRSSETSTNQSDVIIRSDDRFLNLVVDSDSIVSKIYIYA
jgi:hypothetical protein